MLPVPLTVGDGALAPKVAPAVVDHPVWLRRLVTSIASALYDVQYMINAVFICGRYEMVELRHLRYFVAVAEELHFGRAAERVGIAQPPLSQGIQRLERELGLQLFTRTKRRVALTEPGRVFLTEARATLAQAERAVDLARRAARGEVGRLNVGFVGSATFALLPPILRRFRKTHPEVELMLYELSTSQQVAALAERRIDIGFVRPPFDAAGLELEIVDREPLVAVLPAEHPLAARERLRLRDLAGEPFVLFPGSYGPGLRGHIVGACQAAGFNPRIVQEAIGQPTIVSLVSVGIGVSLLPAAIKQLPWQGVVYCRLEDDVPPVEMALAWRRDDDSPALRAFRQQAIGNRGWLLGSRHIARVGIASYLLPVAYCLLPANAIHANPHFAWVGTPKRAVWRAGSPRGKCLTYSALISL
jgi:DNA-binding transcriptional LysR family regulator